MSPRTKSPPPCHATGKVKPKILMLAPHPQVRGPILGIALLLQSILSESGHTVTIAHWGRHSDKVQERQKVLARLSDIVGICRQLRVGHYDVLYIHTSHSWAGLLRDLPLALACRMMNCPVVLEWHGSQPPAYGSKSLFACLSSLLIRSSDVVGLLSSQERDAWQRLVPSGRYSVVTNPYLSQFAEPHFSPEPLLVSGEPILLYVGRVMAEKGILDTVSALPAILSRVSCRLIVVGTGPDLDSVLRQASSLGVRDHVTPVGYLTGTSLRAMYDAATVFVMPTYWKEGFPTVIAEAMDSGLPIVTTRWRGVADHLEEGRNALFVPPNAPDRLAQAIIRLLYDSSMRRSMSEANRALVHRFEPRNVAREYLSLVETAVRIRRSHCASIQLTAPEDA